jgi:Beta-propeller domains of methanol dehydrogenase type
LDSFSVESDVLTLKNLDDDTIQTYYRNEKKQEQIKEHLDKTEVSSSENETESEYTYLLDKVGVISAQTSKYIDEKNEELFSQTGAQIAVEVIDSTGDIELSEYTENEFSRLGVGAAERNNGILLVLALNNDYEGKPVGDYYVGWGSGFSSSESDSISSITNQNMEEDFSAGNYDSAVLNTFKSLDAYLEDGYGINK